MRRVFALAAIVVGAAVLAAGCGGKSDKTSAEDWASNLCSGFVDWSSSVRTAAGSLKGNVSESALKSAAGDIKKATDKLKSDLSDLGTPDTEAGDKAKDTVDTLSSQLKTDVDAIDKAVGDVSGTSGVLQAVSTVSSTLVTVGNQVQAAFRSLQQIDAKGELERAFKNADSCQNLSTQ